MTFGYDLVQLLGGLHVEILVLVLVADVDSFGFVGLVVDVENKADFVHGFV